MEDGVRLILGLGPGPAESVPYAAVEAARRSSDVDLGPPSAARALLESLGVTHRDGVATVARGDGEAWRLAARYPTAACLPERPALESRAAAAALAELYDLTVRLRRDCPWDREQTAATIVPHTLEEAYEVAEKALAGPPDAALVDELGDLLFQTYFLGLLAQEAGVGDLKAVADGVREKLVRRHPHVFGGAAVADADAVRGRWEQIKREQEGRSGIFHDVPPALPSLLHARKLQRRAAAVGFDWRSWEGAWPSLLEEVAELRTELDRASVDSAAEPSASLRHEAGDLLFAAVNVLRLADVDPELELRAAGTRFRGRVEAAERLAEADGVEFALLGLDRQDGYYRAAKAGLGHGR